jgi:hypothetical protein
MAHELPYAFAVGEPVTNVQPPKLKVTGTARFDGFQLPDHGFIGHCGGVPQTFSALDELDGPPLISGQMKAKLDRSRERCEFNLYSAASDILFRYAVTRMAARLENG